MRRHRAIERRLLGISLLGDMNVADTRSILSLPFIIPFRLLSSPATALFLRATASFCIHHGQQRPAVSGLDPSTSIAPTVPLSLASQQRSDRLQPAAVLLAIMHWLYSSPFAFHFFRLQG